MPKFHRETGTLVILLCPCISTGQIYPSRESLFRDKKAHGLSKCVAGHAA